MREDIYVVGYRCKGNVVYGKYHTGVCKSEMTSSQDYAQPMTEKQAKRAVRVLTSGNGKIYKLVEVKL